MTVDAKAAKRVINRIFFFSLTKLNLTIMKKLYLADFFVKLLLKSSQTLKGADVKAHTAAERKTDRDRALAVTGSAHFNSSPWLIWHRRQ